VCPGGVSLVVQRAGCSVTYRAVGKNFDKKIKSFDVPEMFETDELHLSLDNFSIVFTLNDIVYALTGE